MFSVRRLLAAATAIAAISLSAAGADEAKVSILQPEGAILSIAQPVGWINVHAVSIAHLPGVAAITVADAPGSSVEIWSTSSDGQWFPVARGPIGIVGVTMFVVPETGRPYLVLTHTAKGDIRDWLE